MEENQQILLHFNVYLSEQDQLKNPQLMQLLLSLKNHIDKECRSIKLKQQKQQEMEEYERVKFNFIRVKFLYSQIEDCLLDNKLNAYSDTKFKEVYNTFYELWIRAEIFNSITSDEKIIFGLNKQSFQINPAFKRELFTFYEDLKIKTDKSLGKRCEELVSVYLLSPINEDINPELCRSRSLKLTEVVQSGLEKIEHRKKEIKRIKFHCSNLTEKLYKNLMKCVDCLKEVIQKFKLSHFIDFQEVSIQLLFARVEAIHFKIRLMELQLMQGTYNKPSVEALTIISKEIDRKKQDTMSEEEKVNQSLSLYQNLGAEFDSILTEYSNIKAAIDNRKWALKEVLNT